MNRSGILDDVDCQILTILQSEGRVSIAELGRRIGLTSPATGERLERLFGDHVVTGCRALVSARRLGLMVAFIRVRSKPDSYRQVEHAARALPHITECHRITDSDSFLMKAVVSSINALQVLEDIFLAYGAVATTLVTSSVTQERGIPVDEEVAAHCHVSRIDGSV